MINLTGQKFGRLTVLEKHGSIPRQGVVWKCRCDCGNEVIVIGSRLRCGDTKSCGCLHKERAKQLMSTHGQSKTRLYRVWAGIKNRCDNPNSSNYIYYGAKGITVCDEWKNSFVAFRDWALQNGYDENGKAQECTIDRIDNTKGYSPKNCRWVGHIEQCNNQSRNKCFEYNGEIHTMSEWARILGINYSTLRDRIRKGFTFEEAIK